MVRNPLQTRSYIRWSHRGKVNSLVNKPDLWETHKNMNSLGQPAHSPGCGEWRPSAMCTVLRGVNKEMESWNLGFTWRHATMATFSCACQPAGLSGRLPASFSRRSLKSAKYTEKQGYQDRQEEMVVGSMKDRCKGYRELMISPGRQAGSSLWDSCCLHFRRAYIICLTFYHCSFCHWREISMFG